MLCHFCFSFAVLAMAAENKNKFSSIHIQTVLHFHHGEFTGVEFPSNSSQTSQTSHKFHKHSSRPRSCCKTTCSFQKNANAVWQKNWFQFVNEKQIKLIVKNIMHIQENEVAPQTSQIHLQMRSMQQVDFINNC